MQLAEVGGKMGRESIEEKEELRWSIMFGEGEREEWVDTIEEEVGGGAKEGPPQSFMSPMPSMFTTASSIVLVEHSVM